MDGLGMTYTANAVNDLRQQAFNNQQVSTRNNLVNQDLQMDLDLKKQSLQSLASFHAKQQELAQADVAQQKTLEALSSGGASSTPHAERLDKLAQAESLYQGTIAQAKQYKEMADKSYAEGDFGAGDLATKKSQELLKTGMDHADTMLKMKRDNSEQISQMLSPIVTESDQGQRQQEWSALQARALSEGNTDISALPHDVSVAMPTIKNMWGANTKVADQLKIAHDTVTAKRQEILDQSLIAARNSTIAHQRAMEANSRNKGPNGATTNDAKLGTQQNVIYNKYITEYGKLKASYDKAKAGGDDTTAKAVKHEIDILNSNFEQQKLNTSKAFEKKPTRRTSGAPMIKGPFWNNDDDE
jgi:hypothetical protein